MEESELYLKLSIAIENGEITEEEAREILHQTACEEREEMEDNE